jgi:hypothetical protein
VPFNTVPLNAVPSDPPDGPSTTDPALGGPLWVSPAARGSAVVVATDALMVQSERLASLHAGLLQDSLALARLEGLHVGSLAVASAEPAASAALRSAAQLDAARDAVRAAAELTGRTEADLRQAVAAYAVAEDEQRAQAIRLGGLFGILWGPALRMILLSVLPGVLLARAAGIGADDLPLAPLRRWFLEHPEVITDPAFVEGVRATAMSIDDAAGSAAGWPPGVASELAARYGFTGIEAAAAVTVIAGRPLGLFRETPVSVERVETTQGASPPSGSVERLARVPEGDQVRIERYDAPGEPSRFVVYIGPTETFSPVATDEPWDLTSNVTGVAGLDAGSLRATELAMHDAGIRSDDEVQFIGFSQGGLLATRLAASGEWNATGLETYGAPAGGIALPDGLAGMAVRNTDDFIPALGGPQLDHHLLQVERRAFAEGSTIPTTEPVPAHQREAYVATATVVDAARSDAVRAQIAAMDAFTSDYADRDGSSITVTTYRAERGGVKSLGATSSSGGSIP